MYKFKFPAILLTVLVLFAIRLHAEAPATVSVSVSLKKIQFSKMIFGFNSNLTNTPYEYNHPDVIKKYIESGAQYIRFPGGTVANLYNWRTGLKEKFNGINEKLSKSIEWSKKRAKLFGAYYRLDYFLDFLSETKTNFSIVLNIFSLSPDENAEMLQYIKSKGYSVKYIEIGNEIYNKPYRTVYPTVESYMDAAKRYSDAAKMVFPDAKIGVAIPAALYRYSLKGSGDELKGWEKRKIKESVNWYNGIKKISFYDAVIIHMYNLIKWNKEKTLEEFYVDALSKSSEAVFRSTFQSLKSYFPGKKVWVTEWNSGLGPWLSEKYEHTYAKAIYDADFIRKMLLEKQIAIGGLHCFPNLLSPRSLKETGNKMFSGNKSFTVLPAYHVFELLKDAIANSEYVSPISVSGGGYFYGGTGDKKIQLPDLTGIYFSGGKHDYLLVINRWNREYRITFHEPVRIIRSISADSLSAEKVTVTESKTGPNGIYIAPYSINLIE